MVGKTKVGWTPAGRRKSMKSEKDIKDALWLIYKEDVESADEATRKGTLQLDPKFAIRQAWRSVLRWVINEGAAPWL